MTRAADRFGTRYPGDLRFVSLICTGHGHGGHPKRRVDRIRLDEDGMAVSMDYGKGQKMLYRAYAKNEAGKEIADFAMRCPQCSRQPRVSRERMTKLVALWLDQEPARRSVVRDISDPSIARML